jgi:cobalt-zinc-cadmium efflux system outer membrane protein
MRTRTAAAVSIVLVSLGNPVSAQSPVERIAQAERYVDQAEGLALTDAIARAIEQEPLLRAARAQLDSVRGLAVQAELRPNPSVSFERREEPAGTDNLTMVGVEWPLDLFRKSARVDVAAREAAAAEREFEDRARLLAADVRDRYGAAAAAARDLAVLDDVIRTVGMRRDLLAARVEQGASPPLERDLVQVELQRFEALRALQAGRTDAAMFELKRVLGMRPDAALRIRDSLEDLVHGAAAGVAAGSDDGPGVGAGQRPDVLAAEARVAAAAARVERASQSGRLDMSVFGTYMRMDAGFPQQGISPDGGLERVRGVFHYVSAGARITLPLRNRNQGEVLAARADRDAAGATRDAARLQAETEVAVARARDAATQRALQAYDRDARTMARQNLTVIQQSHELGRLTALDVLAEQRRYLEFEQAYTETLRAAYEARAALRRAVGDVR